MKTTISKEQKIIKLPEPPIGMEWFRKPHSNQYVLISSHEFERRMRNVSPPKLVSGTK